MKAMLNMANALLFLQTSRRYANLIICLIFVKIHKNLFEPGLGQKHVNYRQLSQLFQNYSYISVDQFNPWL